jgi:cystathionine gamma-lyase
LSHVLLCPAIADCESAEHALAFSSGMAASVALVQAIPRGAHIVRIDDMYGGTVDYMNSMQDKMGYTITPFSSEEDLESCLKPDVTNLIWLESVTNPTLKMLDLRACCEIAKKHNSKNLIVVDNTFLSPYGMSGLSLGCDVVLHSVTKYINGHSDLVMGVLALNELALFKQLKFIQGFGGAVPSPFDCFLAHRGLRTLALRMRQHEANAMVLARFLEGHYLVSKTLYPGLESHPNHKVAAKQTRCFGGMITFYISGGLSVAACFLGALRLITVAVSLGGVETLIEHPALMTHKMLSKTEREALGISDGLVRLSVGIEDVADLKADIAQALDVAYEARMVNDAVRETVKRTAEIDAGDDYRSTGIGYKRSRP